MLREIARDETHCSSPSTAGERSYSVPCSQTLVGGEDYVEAPARLSGLVRFVRTGGSGDGVIADPGALDPMRVPSRSFTEIKRCRRPDRLRRAVRRAGGSASSCSTAAAATISTSPPKPARRSSAAWRSIGREIWVAPFGGVAGCTASVPRSGIIPGRRNVVVEGHERRGLDSCPISQLTH